MEFIEYYKIIRRRVWIAVVLAAITASVVVAARLMPKETVQPAAGRVLVHEVAKRQVEVAGYELRLGPPADEELFWNNLNHFVHSTYVLATAAADVGIVGGEVERQLAHAQARRLEGSNALEIVAGAKEVGIHPVNPNIASAKDLAVEICDTIMEQLGETWKTRQIARIQIAQETLQERISPLRQEISRLQNEADKFTAEYAGRKPTNVLETLSNELETVQSEIATVQTSQGTAQARVQTLQEMFSQAPATLAREGPVIAASPRLLALQNAIVEKQIELDETRSRRTEAHPEVRSLQAQIEALEQRLNKIVQGEEGQISPQASAALQQADLEARTNVEAFSRQLELLRSRAADVRERLPSVRANARLFEQVDTELTRAQTALYTVEANIERLAAEEEQMQDATMMEVLEPAVAQRVARGLMRFVLQLGVAVFAGGGIGILIIFVLHYIDFSFQNEEEAEEMLGVRVLAGIPRSDVVLYAAAPEISTPEERPPEQY